MAIQIGHGVRGDASAAEPDILRIRELDQHAWDAMMTRVLDFMKRQ